MAREKDKQLAQYYYVEKNKTAKETAILVGITEATMSKWVKLLGWKARREAIATSNNSRCSNIEQVISELAAQRISLSRDLDIALNDKDEPAAKEIRCRLAVIDDGVSKWNKALEGAKKEGKITLSIYLDVMEQIFNALRDYNDKLYLQTVDFQELHIQVISQKL